MVAVSNNIWGKTIDSGESAKEYYPLLAHMLDTATVAEILWNEWLRDGIKDKLNSESNGNAKQLIKFAAGIHDIGKCTPVFQGALLSKISHVDHSAQVSKLLADGFTFNTMDMNLRTTKIHRHEKTGFYILNNSRSDGKNNINDDVQDYWLETVILSHHGSFGIDFGTARQAVAQKAEFQKMIQGKWGEEQQKLIKVVEEVSDISLDEVMNTKFSPLSITLISGIIILADRIASNELSVNDGDQQMKSSNISIHEPLKWVSYRKNLLKLLSEKQVGFPVQITDRDILGDYSPRGVQKIVPNTDGLWICMAPTGSGKTEAALLRHAQKNERLIFLLPTISTTNAMMGRLQKTYAKKEQTVSVLGHGAAFLEDFYNIPYNNNEVEDTGLTPTDFSRVNGAKLSGAVNIATIDQMMAGAIPMKWTHLRLLLLANSHVIIDEVHLLDHYQVRLLQPLLEFLGQVNTRVTLLSATIPSWMEQRFSANYSNNSKDFSENVTVFPSSVTVSPDGTREFCEITDTEEYIAEITVQECESTVEAHVKYVEDTLSIFPRARVGVFVNQVKKAQAIALKIQEDFPDVTVICLHSRMLSKHRKQITDNLLKVAGTNGGSIERFVLVGTQVIEMSLDIDLDFATTDLCPSPSIIQRMGRVWRDKNSLSRIDRIGTHDNMKINIVVPLVKKEGEEDKLNKFALLPYQVSLLNRTLSFLKGLENSQIKFTSEVQKFIETSHLSVDFMDESPSKDDSDEKATEFYKTMKALGVAVKIQQVFNNMLVSEMGSLTDSAKFGEGSATRLIEHENSPLIIISNEKWMQSLGAIPESFDNVKLLTKFQKLSKKDVLAGTVMLSSDMDRTFQEDKNIENVKLPTSKYGYFSELPSWLQYDRLVGLIKND